MATKNTNDGVELMAKVIWGAPDMKRDQLRTASKELGIDEATLAAYARGETMMPPAHHQAIQTWLDCRASDARIEHAHAKKAPSALDMIPSRPGFRPAFIHQIDEAGTVIAVGRTDDRFGLIIKVLGRFPGEMADNLARAAESARVSGMALRLAAHLLENGIQPSITPGNWNAHISNAGMIASQVEVEFATPGMEEQGLVDDIQRLVVTFDPRR